MMPTLASIQVVFAGLVTVLFTAHYHLGELSFEVQAILVSILMLVLGLPHGALDHKIAGATGLVNTRKKLGLFFAGYLLLSIAGFIFWVTFPLASLLFFLLISAWHFGSDFSKFSSLNFFSIIPGAAILTTPFVLYRNDVAQIFSIFVDENNANSLAVIGYYLAYLVIPISITFAWLKSNISLHDRLEFMITLSAGLFLPPLIFLVVFFCISHSLKHLSDLYFSLNFKTIKTFLYALFPMTLLSYLFLGLIALNYSSASSAALSLKSVIILLSVLTIPHMITVEYWKYWSRKSCVS